MIAPALVRVNDGAQGYQPVVQAAIVNRRSDSEIGDGEAVSQQPTRLAGPSARSAVL
jgi:hypothetical protein